MLPDQPSRLERLLDLSAAAVPGAAAAWSASLLGPLFDWPAPVAAPAAGLAAWMIGYAIMRASATRTRAKVQVFSIPFEAELPEELLLDTPWIAPARGELLLLDQPLEDRIDAVAELLLDDPLPVPESDSRVVRMFAAQPKAGELVGRIERHLGRAPQALPSTPAIQAEAADSLRRALDELRRSLRQA